MADNDDVDDDDGMRMVLQKIIDSIQYKVFY